MIKFKHFLLIVYLLSHTVLYAQICAIPRTNIYKALASESLAQIQKQLDLINAVSSIGCQSYKGALLMKKAGLLKKLRAKLQTFKEGKELLENAIALDKENVEYRFLRLMIQENAPPILKYNGNIENDVQLIQKSHHLMAVESRQALKDYAKHSRILTPEDY